jgi:hypothetical protein
MFCRILFSDTHSSIIPLLIQRFFGQMCTCSARALLSNAIFAIMHRSDRDFGVRYTGSARILRSDAHFAIMLLSDTGLGLMYTCYA